MRNLSTLIEGLGIKKVIGNDDIIISEINFDSRKIAKSNLFVAVKGSAIDGHNFIAQSIEKGCVAIVMEEIPKEIDKSITYIQVENCSIALGVLASNWYDNPSQKLKLVGITGTNGKTTCATLLYELHEKMGYPSVLLSTIKVCVHKQCYVATHTTPDILNINKILAQAAEEGCAFAFMEVSSHGIEQNRIAGLNFSVAGFTNITHDHLDYHKTFKNYLIAKKKFFDGLSKDAIAITNIDDKNGLVMLQNTLATKKTYALKTLSDYHAKTLEVNRDGMLLRFNETEFWTQLTGVFNVYNLLLVYGIADSLGMEKDTVIQTISELKNVDGRFESYLSEGGITIVVDYAHTPNALENVLQTIDQIRTKNESLITVFGCGGDRDKEKRPLMGGIASQYSDKIIVTNDNPRSEEGQDIVNQIMEGIPIHKQANTLVITDRRQAIKTAISLAKERDIVLISGKGHEKYQETKGIKVSFDDMAIAVELINQLKK